MTVWQPSFFFLMCCSDCRTATNPNYQGKVKGQKQNIFSNFYFLSQAVDTTAATLRMRISHDTLQLSSRKTVTPSNDSQRGLSGNRAIIFWVQNFAAAWPTGGERCHPWTNSHGSGLVLKSFRAGTSRWGHEFQGRDVHVLWLHWVKGLDHPAVGISSPPHDSGQLGDSFRRLVLLAPWWFTLCFKLVLKIINFKVSVTKLG